uniref:Os01g0778700 protein n=1 Tax=Macrostomum lignano TaxID=282301 RepID=A0A1I8IYR2_9PLAT
GQRQRRRRRQRRRLVESSGGGVRRGHASTATQTRPAETEVVGEAADGRPPSSSQQRPASSGATPAAPPSRPGVGGVPRRRPCRRCRLAKHSPPTWLGFAGACWPIRGRAAANDQLDLVLRFLRRPRKAPARLRSRPGARRSAVVWRGPLLADFVRRYARETENDATASAARTVAARLPAGEFAV